jgi:hypothetical protein
MREPALLSGSHSRFHRTAEGHGQTSPPHCPRSSTARLNSKAFFAAVHSVENGPSRHLMRRGGVSGVEGKADSKNDP